MNKRRVWALVLSIVMVLSVFAYVPVQNVEAAGVSVQYKSHVQTFGWESAWKRDGEASGTSGKAKRLEGIRITVSGDNLGVRYTTHCQTYGWLPWVSNGEMSGTQGEAKRLEAIKIELTGANAQNYDIYYRVHAQSYGWLAWAKNGQAAGTAGLAKRLEAIQIVVVAAVRSHPSVSFIFAIQHFDMQSMVHEIWTLEGFMRILFIWSYEGEVMRYMLVNFIKKKWTL